MEHLSIEDAAQPRDTYSEVVRAGNLLCRFRPGVRSPYPLVKSTLTSVPFPSMTKAVSLLLACVLCLPALAAAQAMPPMPGMHTFPPPDQLPFPIRMSGIGNSHITIHATPEAQAWFDQGLSLLHDFWDYESAKAFEQAIRTDPHCAMC